MIRVGDVTIDRERKRIHHNGAMYQWKSYLGRPSVKFLTVQHLLLSDGMSARELFDIGYSWSAEGGPLDGPHVMYIQFCQLKPIFDKLHLVLRKRRHLGELLYWLEPQ